MVNDAAVNTGIQVSVQVPDFNTFEYTPRSEIAGSYDNLMINFLRNH